MESGTPEIRAFYKRHKEITKVDADYAGSPVYYAMLQMLTETIETLGSTDRMAIADHIRKNKFKTLVGDLSLPGQTLDKVYTVGQWQNGFFNAVNGTGYSEFAPVKLKTNWGDTAKKVPKAKHHKRQGCCDRNDGGTPFCCRLHRGRNSSATGRTQRA